MIYTSGSTGTAKGVMIEHRALAHYVQVAVQAFDLTAQDYILQFASIGFDAAAEEIYPCLVSGATLVLRTEAMLDPQTLLAFCCEAKITVLDLPTAFWHQLTDSLCVSPEPFPESVRLVILGGERALPAYVAEWRERVAPDVRLLNTYGPTEATIVTTMFDMNTAETLPGEVPIGRPIPGALACVLDPYQQPVPVGVPGELYIGGLGLARAYMNNPALTAERFVQPAFQPETRLYRTGDKVRLLPDGNLEFMGRLDRQLKLSGFRVELDEVEAVLRQAPAVRDTAALVRETASGMQSLLAFVVSADRSSEGELRAYLSNHLPAYMMPSHIRFLPHLPLSASGKVDYTALAQLNSEETAAVADMPRSPLEETLAQLWCNILGLEQVGVYDNFFELGGHSLSATQLIVQLRRVFHSDVPLDRFFEGPTIDELARCMSQGDALPTSIPRRASTVLSFAQEQLWLFDQLTAHKTAYIIRGAVHLSGTLNLPAWEQSLREIVRRHEVLRAAFHTVNGKPVLEILPLDSYRMQVEDCRAADIEQRLREIAAQPVDLEKGHLFQTWLFIAGEEDYIFHLSVHHIVYDGWSLGVLLKELTALYAAFSSGQPSPLPELPIQYSDFAVWQREQLAAGALEGQIAYWRQQLAGKLPILELPTDRTRPALQSFHGQILFARISPALTDRLRALSRESNVTLFMTLLAVFNVLLYRYTRQEDLIVGTPVANRRQPETEELIGPFINLLPLRSHLSAEDSFQTLLEQVRAVTLAAYTHQDLPFLKLLELVEDEPDRSHSPIFQTLFVFQNLPLSEAEFAGLSLSSEVVETGIARYDLTLTLHEANGGLDLSVEYSTDLFDATTIERLIGHYQTLLEAVVNQPDQAIGRLPLLTPAESEQILHTWNATRVDYPPGQTILSVFEAQVECSPEATALVFGTDRLSYRQLDMRANQLAQVLIRKEVDPESIVAVFLERSLDLVISLYAILKAGGAYMPIDPDYPPEQIAYMLDDAQPVVLLTETRLQPRLPKHEYPMCCLDTLGDALDQESSERPTVRPQGEDLAYVIYTSGSTGRPKGVLNTHKGIYNRLCWMQDAFKLEASDCVLQKTPYSFDVSVWEFFWPLMYGARLVLAAPGAQRDSRALIDLIDAEQVTTIHFVPSMLQQFLKDAELARCTSLRRVICSGEVLSVKLQKEFFRLMDAELHNLYGPTEAAIDVTHWQCLPDQPQVPIGRPIANIQLYILDADRQPLPVGVPGELYIGGVGLARSYRNLPDLTAKVFIADPFSTEPEARLYRTGDLARYQPDGNIEYLGRTDRQVKIRGHRIELGEIEAVLLQYPALRQVCVIMHPDQRLAAYLVFENAHQNYTVELRNFLRERLPDYMIPSAFVTLDSLPLNANGKVAISMLPAPSISQASVTAAAPRSPLEAELVQIWQDALGFDQVGVHDNFFDLGGHSLLALEVIHRIEQTTGQRLPPALMRSETLAQLAMALEAQANQRPSRRARRDWRSVCNVSCAGTKPPMETFFFGPPNRALFAAFYPPQAEVPRETAVILCYPIGQEYIRSHRAYHQLALNLTRQGFPVLKFDYYGTGNSAGDDHVGSLAEWARDIAAAVDEMRRVTGLERICFVGLRMGGSLALQVGAGMAQAVGFALWEPVVSGSAYLEELFQWHRDRLWYFLSSVNSASISDEPQGELLGFAVSEHFLNELKAFDLLRLTISAGKQALIVENTPSEAVAQLMHTLNDQAVETLYEQINSLVIWREDPDKGLVPQVALRTIVNWVDETFR